MRSIRVLRGILLSALAASAAAGIHADASAATVAPLAAAAPPADAPSIARLRPYLAADGKFGFADASGRLVIPARYTAVQPFFDGLAAAEENGKWGYLDESGRWRVPPRFTYAYPFHEGQGEAQIATARIGLGNERRQNSPTIPVPDYSFSLTFRSAKTELYCVDREGRVRLADTAAAAFDAPDLSTRVRVLQEGHIGADWCEIKREDASDPVPAAGAEGAIKAAQANAATASAAVEPKAPPTPAVRTLFNGHAYAVADAKGHALTPYAYESIGPNPSYPEVDAARMAFTQCLDKQGTGIVDAAGATLVACRKQYVTPLYRQGRLAAFVIEDFAKSRAGIVSLDGKLLLAPAAYDQVDTRGVRYVALIRYLKSEFITYALYDLDRRAVVSLASLGYAPYPARFPVELDSTDPHTPLSFRGQDGLCFLNQDLQTKGCGYGSPRAAGEGLYLAFLRVPEGERPRYGALDGQGAPAIAMRYDEPFYFQQGLAEVSRGGRQFYIDRSGKEYLAAPPP
jgi:hypothetical protein